MIAWRVFPLLFLVGFSVTALADAVEYALRPARGLVIYKEHDFASDKTAVLLEYLTFQVHDKVTYLVTPDGKRLTVPARGSNVFLLPYPGKGEATPREALVVLAYADEKFPQFHSHIHALQKAWSHEAKRPAAHIQEELAAREKNQGLGAAFIKWLKSLTPQLPPLKLPPSPLEPMPTEAAGRKPEPERKDPSEEGQSGETDSLGLEGNLKKIKEFYELQKTLE